MIFIWDLRRIFALSSILNVRWLQASTFRIKPRINAFGTINKRLQFYRIFIVECLRIAHCNCARIKAHGHKLSIGLQAHIWYCRHKNAFRFTRSYWFIIQNPKKCTWFALSFPSFGICFASNTFEKKKTYSLKKCAYPSHLST